MMDEPIICAGCGDEIPLGARAFVIDAVTVRHEHQSCDVPGGPTMTLNPTDPRAACSKACARKLLSAL